MIWRSRSLSCRSASSIAFSVSGSSGRLSLTGKSEHIRARLTTRSMPLIHFAAARPTIIRLASGRPSPVPRGHAANRALRARGLRNVPNSESDESFLEVVEVRDPHHPLYGRSFRVIWKIGQRGRGIPASYEVEFRTRSSLLIQATAIEYYGQEANQIKLSMEALLELLSTADCPDAHEHGSSRSLVDADARAPTPDRRRRRRDFGGDPS